jgi:hypothetical protein
VDPLRAVIHPAHHDRFDRLNQPLPETSSVAASAELQAVISERGFRLEGATGMTLSSASANHHGGEQNSNLSDIIRDSKTKECEDPRDMIFGMLALIDWQGRPPITPDYKANAFELAVKLCAHDLRTSG